jgi:hypothetical protein
MGKRMAFLVGIDDYGEHSGLAKLKYAEADARLMAETLEELSGFSTKILPGKQATRDEIIHGLHTFYDVDDLDLFLFYFSGHGEYIPEVGLHYLHCYGSERGDTLGTLKTQEWANRIERRIWANQIVLVMDACRNRIYRGAQTRGTPGLDSSVPSALKEISGHTHSDSSTPDYMGERFFYTLLSCGAGQFSYEDEELKQGLFTYALVKEIKENGAKFPLNKLHKKVGEYTFKRCKRNNWYPYQIPEWIEPSVTLDVYLGGIVDKNFPGDEKIPLKKDVTILPPYIDNTLALSGKQLDALRIIHEDISCNLSALLSSYLKAQVDVKLKSIEALTYTDFLSSLTNPTYINAILMKKPIREFLALEIDSKILFPMINILDGKAEEPSEENRNINDLDKGLMDGLVETVLEGLEEGWEGITPFNISVIQTETSPHSFAKLTSLEKIVSISFELTVGRAEGLMHFFIPNTFLISIGNDLNKIDTNH